MSALMTARMGYYGFFFFLLSAMVLSLCLVWIVDSILVLPTLEINVIQVLEAMALSMASRTCLKQRTKGWYSMIGEPQEIFVRVNRDELSRTIAIAKYMHELLLG
jgi:hypothetical protein